MRKYGKCEKNTNLQGVMKTLVNPKLLESKKMAKIATFFFGMLINTKKTVR